MKLDKIQILVFKSSKYYSPAGAWHGKKSWISQKQNTTWSSKRPHPSKYKYPKNNNPKLPVKYQQSWLTHPHILIHSFPFFSIKNKQNLPNFLNS